MHISAFLCMGVCMCVRGSNWRKINRCEEEQTDMMLAEVVVVGVVGFERECMWKSTPATTPLQHTPPSQPLFHFKRSRWLRTCTRLFYVVKRDARK